MRADSHVLSNFHQCPLLVQHEPFSQVLHTLLRESMTKCHAQKRPARPKRIKDDARLVCGHNCQREDLGGHKNYGQHQYHKVE